MALVYLGTDFNETPLSDLEKLGQITDALAISFSNDRGPLDGSVVLGTCNRFEIYLETASFHDGVEFVTSRVAQHLDITSHAASSLFKVMHGDSVPQHLFSVSAGLESMIVGEEEIAGQVKRALADAQDRGTATKQLNQLFQKAASVSKVVTTETGLGASGRSIIMTALEIATERIGGLERAFVLLIGTGAYSRVVSAALERHGVAEIGVYSRTGRAEQFSLSRGTTPVRADQLKEWIARADLIVSASGMQGYAIDAELLSSCLAERTTDQPLVCIDVSLSKDVDPAVSDLPHVEVIDLEWIRERAPEEHSASLVAARDIIREAVVEFNELVQARSADPVVALLRERVAETIEEEIAAVRRRAGDHAATLVERSLRRVTNSMLHTPTVNAKELALSGKQDKFVEALELLFGIEVLDVN